MEQLKAVLLVVQASLHSDVVGLEHGVIRPHLHSIPQVVRAQLDQWPVELVGGKLQPLQIESHSVEIDRQVRANSIQRKPARGRLTGGFDRVVVRCSAILQLTGRLESGVEVRKKLMLTSRKWGIEDAGKVACAHM